MPRALDVQASVSPNGKFTWLRPVGPSLKSRLPRAAHSPPHLPCPVPDKGLILDRGAEQVPYSAQLATRVHT